MLAPVAEAQFGEDALLELSLRAAASFPEFCAELEEASGSDPGLRASGTLVVARDRDEAEALDRLLAFRQRLGLAVERLLPTAARRAEPALAPTVRLALDIAGDHSVDPRRLVAALAEAVRRAGGGRARACARGRAVDGHRRAARGRRGDRGRRGPDRRGRALGPLRRGAGAPGQGAGPAAPRPAGRGPGRADDPHPRRLPRPARGRPLRARRHDGGARLRHRADRRRRVRAAARRRRRSCRACSSWRSRSCWRACGRRRPTTCRRSGRGELDGPVLGDRPLPQRHPALRPDRRAGRRDAVRRASCRAGRRRADARRFAGVPA